MTQHRLDRRAVVKALLADRGDLLVVSGLGGTSWDVAAAGDDGLNFPLWGGMGTAVVTGLGLALAQPERPVVVITGDGEMLMGLGSLATIAVQAPPNLAIIVLDNQRYGETGEQTTHTADGVDLCAVARAAGFGEARNINAMDDVEALASRIRMRDGCLFASIRIEPGSAPMVLPPRDGPFLKSRFRNRLLDSREG